MVGSLFGSAGDGPHMVPEISTLLSYGGIMFGIFVGTLCLIRVIRGDHFQAPSLSAKSWLAKRL